MSRTSRRQFAKTLTLLPVVATALATELAADAPSVKPPKKPPADLSTLVERLRQFPLVNADEPDVTFSALTKRWSASPGLSRADAGSPAAPACGTDRSGMTRDPASARGIN